MTLTQKERNVISKAFENGDLKTFKENGIRVQGVKYMFIKGDGKWAQGMNIRDKQSIILQKTKSAIIIAHTVTMVDGRERLMARRLHQFLRNIAKNYEIGLL